MAREQDEHILHLPLRTERDLLDALGVLTPEEEARLNDPTLYAPLTAEEEARLPNTFTEDILRLIRERRSAESSTPFDVP